MQRTKFNSSCANRRTSVPIEPKDCYKWSQSNMYTTSAQRQNQRAATSLERCYGGVGSAAQMPPHKA
jgi:hypothetical protein